MINDYLNVVTSEYRDKPKARAFLKAKLDFIQDLAKCLADMPKNFDLDKAKGKQLDILGEIVGVSRIVSISDTEALKLNDNDFLIYIKAKIIKNYWNGELQTLQEMWYELFGYQIVIVDNQDMTIDILFSNYFSDTIISLFRANKIFPKPMGVLINYRFAITEGKSFGLVNANDEYEEENLAGFDEGIWRQ